MSKAKITKQPNELYTCFKEAAEFLIRTNIGYGISSTGSSARLIIGKYDNLAAFTSAFSKILFSSFEAVKEEIYKVAIIERPRYILEAIQYLREEFDLLFTILQEKVSLPIKTQLLLPFISSSTNLTAEVHLHNAQVKEMENRIRQILDEKLELLNLLIKESQNRLNVRASTDVKPTGSMKDLNAATKPEAFAVLYRLLTNGSNPLLDSPGGLPNFRKAFSEDRSDFKQLKWLGTVEELRYLITQLEKKENAQSIIEFTTQAKWPVVSALFIKPDGSPILAKTLAGNAKTPLRAKELDEIVSKVKEAIGI